MPTDNAPMPGDDVNPDAGVVNTLYSARTDYLLEKYGTDSPRVHYHLGPVAADSAGSPLPVQMHRAQEALLDHCFGRWASSNLAGRVLDVGCGLGGTLIYLAEKYGARAVGLTIAEAHPPVIAELAERASVDVEVRVGDIHAFSDAEGFDTIVTFEAMNLFHDRATCFQRMRDALKPGGTLCIDDYFSGPSADVALFNRAYVANIGDVDSYLRCAESVGLELMETEDISALTADFWRLCAEYADATKKGDPSVFRQTRALHEYMLAAQRDGSFRHCLLRFVRPR